MPTRILIIGSGGREHAITKACVRSREKIELYCLGTSRNPGIQTVSSDYLIGSLTATDKITEYALSKKIDFVIIGPESALEAGVADALEAIGIPCIGPKKSLARIETSKSYARDLLFSASVPGIPHYQVFHTMDGAAELLTKLRDGFVIKADGLMSGKGVKVSGDHLPDIPSALRYCEELIAAESPFVIEEKCVGVEFSLMSFTDGITLAHMPAVQDYKRAFVNDEGPNTGGMGSISDANHSLPFLAESDINEARKINEASLKVLCDTVGERYTGILYGGFMATRNGVKLIEFNARFGDPESINALGILQTDFVEVCRHIIEGTLAQLPINFDHVATVCKYAVPEGYPDNPMKGGKIDISALPKEVDVYYAGIDEKGGVFYGTGSRTLAVLGKAPTITQAADIAEEMISAVGGPFFHRPDIGSPMLVEKRIDTMKILRSYAWHET
ncbi:phosphoribosylamine--glycine ligase [Candidatus Uhrbacteria bacterium]|nr:phosphoribosylamine--glycine ligase [Candidatus Uhrbacteria bacterium]